MKLEDLVPPLALCQQIPEGKFAESELVWGCLGHRGIEEVYSVWLRCSVSKTDKFFPAPTLEEILDALSRMDKIDMVNVWAEGFGWNAQTISNSERTKTAREKADNPTTAALKLWLEVQK